MEKTNAAKVILSISLNPFLLEDSSLKMIYLISTKISNELADFIEELIQTPSESEKMEKLNEKVSTLDVESFETKMSVTDKVSAMSTLLDELNLPDDEELESQIKNWFQCAITNALIEEFD